MSSSLSEISLAIDWIPKKIYLLEKTVNRIDVFTLNGEKRTNLITSDINIPTAIVLDPNEGFYFLLTPELVALELVDFIRLMFLKFV